MFGINISGGEFGSGQGRYGWDYIYPSAQTIQYYADKGFDTIRLPVKWERLQPSLNGALDTAEIGRIKAVLDIAQATGMKVVLDIHNYAYYDGGTIGTASVPISSFANLWSRLAAELKSHPAIEGYGLMNEPIGFTNMQTWPDAAQAAINAIRAVDGNTAIYVAGQNWGSAMNWPENNDNLKHLQDPSGKLVFEAHQYFDRWNTGTYQGSYDSEGAYANIGVDRLQPFLNWLKENNLKGFIGEYAVPDNDPRWLTVIDNFVTELARHNIPSAYWGGGPWWGNYPMSIEPENGVDAPQMAVLLKNIEAYAQAQTAAALQSGKATEELAIPVMVLEGTAQSDVMNVSAGHIGLLRGLSGNDRLTGAELADALYGGEGNDKIYGEAGDDYLDGGEGNNKVYGGAGDDRLLGGAGADYLYGDAGADVATGGAGNDVLYGGDGADRLSGEDGNDKIYGEAGDDYLDGGEGSNKVYGGDGNDRLLGGAGADSLYGDAGNDVVTGGDGNDVLYGGDGADRLSGGAGNDKLYGQTGDDYLDGGDGTNKSYGGDGNDVLRGGSGVDYLYGEGGDDTLNGGSGADILYGGRGADIFVFEPGTAFSGIDTMYDFSTKEMDRIDLSSLLGAYDPLVHAIADFVQITTSGRNSILKVDIDGGGDTFVQVATIANITGLTDEAALVANGNLMFS